MNEEVERIHMTIAQAEAKVARAAKVETLLQDPLFKEVITEDYLGDDAVRLTVNLKPGDENKITHAMLEAKAVFSRFIAHVIAEGAMAESSLEEHKELMNSIDKE